MHMWGTQRPMMHMWDAHCYVCQKSSTWINKCFHWIKCVWNFFDNLNKFLKIFEDLKYKIKYSSNYHWYENIEWFGPLTGDPT